MTQIQIEDIRVGFKKESTDNTDPITSGNTVFKFGRYQITPGKFPSHTIDTTPYYAPISSREPLGYLTNTKPIQNSILFDYISGYPLWLFFGAESGTTTKTITPSAVGTNKPTFTTRHVRNSATLNERVHVSGCKLGSISMSVDYRVDALPRFQTAYRGRSLATSSFANNPVIVTNATNANYDIPTTMTWDGVSVKEEVLGFTWTAVDTGVIPPPELNSLVPPSILHREMIYKLSIEHLPGQNNTFAEFWRTWAIGDPGKTLIWRHDQQGTSNYVQITFGGVTPAGLIDAPQGFKDINIDRLPFNYTTFSCETIDGTTAAYTGL